MKLLRVFNCALLATLVALSSASIRAEDATPSATLTITEKQVGFFLTGDWGHGTLKYKDEIHMFHLGGGEIGGIGIAEAKVEGSVYNVNQLEDFEGTYFKADAALTVRRGPGAHKLRRTF